MPLAPMFVELEEEAAADRLARTSVGGEEFGVMSAQVLLQSCQALIMRVPPEAARLLVVPPRWAVPGRRDVHDVLGVSGDVAEDPVADRLIAALGHSRREGRRACDGSGADVRQ